MELWRRRSTIGLVLHIWVVRHTGMVILRWYGVLRLVVGVGVHVVVVHWRSRLVMLLLLMLLMLLMLLLIVLVIWPSSIHIVLHALPCRQRTPVHHAGLGVRIQFDV